MTLKRRRFVDRRKAVGYTQESLAQALGVERTTVVRWERAATDPQPWVRPRLAARLKVTAEGLADLLADVVELPDGDGRVLASSVPLEFSLPADRTVHVVEGFAAHDIASRRQVLAGLSVLGGAALLRPVRQWTAAAQVERSADSSADGDEVAELEQAVGFFRRWDASGAGGLRRKAVVGQLSAVAEMLREDQPPGVAGRLFQVSAELAQLAGWMAYDQGLAGKAQRYYLLALHACREAACPELGAKVLGDMTQLSTALGRYEDSLALVRAALYSLPRNQTVVRAELLGLEARAYAHLGGREAGNAARSAETCVAVWHEAAAERVPDWMHYMNQAEVDCLAANAYIELAMSADDTRLRGRHAARAEAHTVSACGGRESGYTRSRLFDELRLAKVRLAQGEPEEAARVAVGCLTRAERMRSHLVVEWLVQFHQRLASRHPGASALAGFQEPLRDYVRAAAPHREPDVAWSS